MMIEAMSIMLSPIAGMLLLFIIMERVLWAFVVAVRFAESRGQP